MVSGVFQGISEAFHEISVAFRSFRDVSVGREGVPLGFRAFQEYSGGLMVLGSVPVVFKEFLGSFRRAKKVSKRF